MDERKDRGFTHVEAIRFFLVLAMALLGGIPIINERERHRLEALADTEPWKVFELRATPVKSRIMDYEEFVVQFEIVNRTKYSLAWPDRSTYYLYPWKERFYISIASWRSPITGKQWYVADPPEGTVIAPSKPLRLEMPFTLEWPVTPNSAGPAKFTIVPNGLNPEPRMFESNPFELTIEPSGSPGFLFSPIEINDGVVRIAD